MGGWNGRTTEHDDLESSDDALKGGCTSTLAFSGECLAYLGEEALYCLY